MSTSRTILESRLGTELYNRARIDAVDGLRAVAALGVLWAHVWAFTGTPRLSLGTVAGIDLDLNRIISVVGSGVDLFFVISGFCMHLMYARYAARFDPAQYWVFIAKRWRRIAPAFYVCATVCALGFALTGSGFSVRVLLAHFAFLHIVVPDTGRLAAPFWSLATEWHFYLLLPVIIVIGSHIGSFRMLALLAVTSIAFRVVVYAGAPEVEALWKPQLATRLVEFLWGVLVSMLFQQRRTPPRILQGNIGFAVCVGLAYLGRLLMVTEVMRAFAPYGWILRAFSEPVMTLGFALILWNVLTTQSWGRILLELRATKIVGRWSYSLYLWHWWPTYWLSTAMGALYGSSALIQYVSFTLLLLVLLPFSWLSYRLFELPYFRREAISRSVPSGGALRQSGE